MIVDDRRIRILNEAVEAGSMRAAADHLDVAPSSISRQIASLEAELGTALIEHGRRDIRLTDAGKRVLAYYQDISSRKKHLTEELSDLAGNLTGQVQIAIGEGFLGPAFYATIDEFSADFPNVSLSVRVTDTAEIMRLIADDDLHFGVVFHPVGDFNLTSRFSARVPLKLLLRSDHPLAGEQQVSLKQLEKERMALMHQRFRIRQVIDLAATESKASLRCMIETNSIAMLLEAVRTGRALTILPEFSADADIASGQLHAISFSELGLHSLNVHMVTRAKRYLTKPAHYLMERLRSRLGAVAH